MEDIESQEYKRAILEYWMLVEFFSPYLLENALDSKQKYQKIYRDEPGNEPLPWLNAQVIQEDDPASPFAKGYHLYLGLFSVEETADRARHAFAKVPSQWQSVNWRNCGQPNSITAFARLTVTTHGIPLIGSLSLSTLPWAHGRLLNEQKDSLTIEQYWKSVNHLLVQLREEFHPGLPKKLVKEPKMEAGFLDLPALYKLTEFLFAWSHFKPVSYPIALIEPLSFESSQAAKEPTIQSERDVPVLNSFFIQDLEAAIVTLPTQKSAPIDLYLNPEHETRILLDSEEGKKSIVKAIRPEKIPSGRWLDPPFQKQSLMQQFAINAAFESLKEKGIFSVNGPPGTGKTSLLKEIIAENIVARASHLSQFKSAQDAFVERHALSFESADQIIVSELDPSLIGYEMLIVSSNNTAVQNLSQELPLRSQLDPSFHHASYLETVATKLLEVKEKEAWGLLAATLGNVENCLRFVERVFIEPSQTKGASRIWEWVDEYIGPSFDEAKEAFITIKNHQEKLFSELATLALLHEELHDKSIESYCANELKALFDVEEESDRHERELSKLVLEESEDKELLALLQEQERLWKEERPNPLIRVVDRQASKAWNEKQRSIKRERMQVLERLHKCKQAQKVLTEQFHFISDIEEELTKQLLDQALLFSAFQQEHEALMHAHPTARFPSENLDSTEPYYQTYETNKIRSDLFVAALQLHEAWLSVTLRVNGGFRGNLMAVSNLLQGKSPTTADDTRLAWQSAFLLFPVISSTFASIGRLFRHLEPGSLGWVLIEEAGQAHPQAAVGAIWRAKKVLSIGDPFQIEPICHIPGEVIDGMAKSKIQDYRLRYAPSQVSVQSLMDRVSTLGSMRMVAGERYWLGSPLRVHRRCLEPMFSIANSIAYESSMLLATEPGQELLLPPSCWWDIGGHTTDRQFVPAQGDALLQLLKEAFACMDDPDLFVISPFREVINQLQQRLIKDKELQALFTRKYPITPFHAWLQQAIGTVHIFQGKQAHAVFFVLGGDKSTYGAIDWASRKPNLLNVAVTRAKSRLYLVGDYDLWKIWPHFDVAARKLIRKKLVL